MSGKTTTKTSFEPTTEPQAGSFSLTVKFDDELLCLHGVRCIMEIEVDGRKMIQCYVDPDGKIPAIYSDGTEHKMFDSHSCWVGLAWNPYA